MKAVHVFCIAVIIFSIYILGGAGSESHQELVLKYEKSGTRNFSVTRIWGTNLWETEITEVVPVSVGDVAKWEFSASPESISHFQVGTRAKSFYENWNCMNDSGTHKMQKDDYKFESWVASEEVLFNWGFQLYLHENPPAGGKKTTLFYHIEVYEAPKRFRAFKRYMPLQGLY